MAGTQANTKGWVIKVGAFALFWAVLGIGLYLTVGERDPNVLLGVALAAALSGVLILKTLLDQFEGTIEKIVTERVFVRGNDDEPGYHKDVVFAYVRLTSRRQKKMRAMPAWQVGDTLRKVRGRTQTEHIPLKQAGE